MKRKSGLSKFNSFLAIVLVICIAATAYVIHKYPKIETVSAETTETGDSDPVVIDAFAEGTYGGKEFKTQEDVVNYYNECYDYTKTLTAEYVEGGEKKTYYKLVGEEHLDVGNLLVEGKSNSTINNLVPTIVGGLFSGNVIGLTPSGNRDPSLDTRNDGAMDCTTSQLTADDILAANVVDNGDGTITMTLQPKQVYLSMPGEDAQGRLFNSLGDISSVVESIDVLSFSEGTIDDNFVVDYKGGTAVVTIDTATNEITKADYVMKVHVTVSHANVLVLKDKNAELDITYTVNYPATDTFMKEQKDLSRA